MHRRKKNIHRSKLGSNSSAILGNQGEDISGLIISLLQVQKYGALRRIPRPYIFPLTRKTIRWYKPYSTELRLSRLRPQNKRHRALMLIVREPNEGCFLVLNVPHFSGSQAAQAAQAFAKNSVAANYLFRSPPKLALSHFISRSKYSQC